ncbi:MAG: hypothetical protein PHO10_00425 [Gemmiger sp.]|nr:hypothetical protein [Gemmiger sp.]
MMKARLLPLYFAEANERENAERGEQLRALGERYAGTAEFLPAAVLGTPVPAGVDAVVFPQLLGAVFAHKAEMEKLQLPILVLTSEFGTVEMWDWEIVAYLREQLGLLVLTPYTVELANVLLRAMAAKRYLRSGACFLIFEDTPGEGMQANIFKRFYWWETQCTARIEAAFGVKILYRSWRALNEEARAIPDEAAAALWQARAVPQQGVSPGGILKAVKLYMAIKRQVDAVGNVVGVGANCLNESFHSDTTPCLAWNWMYEYDHILWACEGDTVTLISEYILHSALERPLMMTNIYPFLVGMAALKHEKIEKFPAIDDPDNHALGVHCGYFGMVPQSFCAQWMLRPKVLEIVGDDAVAIDCRMRPGPVTMAKLHSDMQKLTIIQAEIEGYEQYPGSDCRNGALLRYQNNSGHQVMESLSSHHAILIAGDATAPLLQMAKIYGFATEVL